LEGGPPSFRQGFSCPAVLRYPDHLSQHDFVYGTLTPCSGAFQLTSTIACVQTGQTPSGPYNPEVQAPRFGLLPVRSPLLGESRLISLPGATEMFQFTPLASLTLLGSGGDDSLERLPGFPIRASPDQGMRAPPRRFSQLTAPFLACPCLGIPRAPLYA
jgi:hypothetical protein